MTNCNFRYASHPLDFEKYGTEELRDHYLIEKLFVRGQINLTYTMFDRYIVGGVMPSSEGLVLETIDHLKSENFLDRRELGIVNVGETGTVIVDGEVFELQKKEALYVGKGSKAITFANASGKQALFYINSAPAHKRFPSKKIGQAEAEIVELGDTKYSNRRTLYKLIVNSLVETCQLQMGLTELHSGNVWNTMPAHTHERRMEAYFYFDLEDEQTICHFMGPPQHTRHIFLQNNNAVISPEWSIHSGAGTASYSFVWGMAGENLDYGDMDKFKPSELK